MFKFNHCLINAPFSSSLLVFFINIPIISYHGLYLPMCYHAMRFWYHYSLFVPPMLMYLMCTVFFITHLSRFPCTLSKRASAHVWGDGESVMTSVRQTSGTLPAALHVAFRLPRIPTSSQEGKGCPPLSDCLRGREPLCHSDPCCGPSAKPAAHPAAKLMKFQKSVPVRSDAAQRREEESAGSFPAHSCICIFLQSGGSVLAVSTRLPLPFTMCAH